MSNLPIAQELVDMYSRDLDRFAQQVRDYPSDEVFWTVAGQTLNSGGTLAHHASGNLLHFIGATLGGTGYVRDREAEFSGTVLSREELIERLMEAKRVIAEVLPSLSAEQWDAPMPGIPDRMAGKSTRWFMIHLYGHLNWHLGQIDYHRRILS
jgi:hypothetical protein